MQLAEPLLIKKYEGVLRFRSLLNWRVYSFFSYNGFHEFVELDRDRVQPFVVKIIYQGRDAEAVKKLIVKEVCDVQ